MKKNVNEVMRVKKLIESDKLDAKDEFFNLLTIDLDNLLKDYFEYGGYPDLSIVKEGGGYKVGITFRAERLKNFTSLPKI